MQLEEDKSRMLRYIEELKESNKKNYDERVKL